MGIEVNYNPPKIQYHEPEVTKTALLKAFLIMLGFVSLITLFILGVEYGRREAILGIPKCLGENNYITTIQSPEKATKPTDFICTNSYNYGR